MPVGVVPHYRPCLLAWYLSKGHACWFVAIATDMLLVECRWKNDGYKSGATCTDVPLHQTCLLIRCHSEIFQLVPCNSIIHACGFIYSDTHVYKVLLHGLLQIHQACLQVRCHSHGFVKRVGYHPGHHLDYMKF